MDEGEREIAMLRREVAEIRKQMGRMPARFAIGNGGGGGNLKVYYAADEDALRAITPAEDFAKGFTTDLYEREEFSWLKTHWMCTSHFRLIDTEWVDPG